MQWRRIDFDNVAFDDLRAGFHAGAPGGALTVAGAGAEQTQFSAAGDLVGNSVVVGFLGDMTDGAAWTFSLDIRGPGVAEADAEIFHGFALPHRQTSDGWMFWLPPRDFANGTVVRVRHTIEAAVYPVDQYDYMRVGVQTTPDGEWIDIGTPDRFGNIAVSRHFFQHASDDTLSVHIRLTATHGQFFLRRANIRFRSEILGTAAGHQVRHWPVPNIPTAGIALGRSRAGLESQQLRVPYGRTFLLRDLAAIHVRVRCANSTGSNSREFAFTEHWPTHLPTRQFPYPETGGAGVRLTGDLLFAGWPSSASGFDFVSVMAANAWALPAFAPYLAIRLACVPDSAGGVPTGTADSAVVAWVDGTLNGAEVDWFLMGITVDYYVAD